MVDPKQAIIEFHSIYHHLLKTNKQSNDEQHSKESIIYKDIKPEIPKRIQYVAIIGESLSGKKYLLKSLIPKGKGHFFKKGFVPFCLLENTLFEVVNLGHKLLNGQDPFETASVIIYIFREFRNEVLKSFEHKAIENDKLLITINNSNISKSEINTEKKHFGETKNLTYNSQIETNNKNDTQYIYAKQLTFGNKKMMSFNFFLLKNDDKYNSKVVNLINEIIMNNPKLTLFTFPEHVENDGTNIAELDMEVKKESNEKIIEPEYNIIKENGSVTIEVIIAGVVSDVTSSVSSDKSEKRLISIIIEGKRNLGITNKMKLLGKLNLREGKFRIHIKKPFHMIPIINTVPEFTQNDNGILSFKYKTLEV